MLPQPDPHSLSLFDRYGKDVAEVLDRLVKRYPEAQLVFGRWRLNAKTGEWDKPPSKGVTGFSAAKRTLAKVNGVPADARTEVYDLAGFRPASCGMVVIDVDGTVDEVAVGLVWKGGLVARSVSGGGLHVVYRLPPGVDPWLIDAGKWGPINGLNGERAAWARFAYIGGRDILLALADGEVPVLPNEYVERLGLPAPDLLAPPADKPKTTNKAKTGKPKSAKRRAPKNDAADIVDCYVRWAGGASFAQSGEQKGPCPLCGGTDRFHVKVEQGKCVAHCRKCSDSNSGGWFERVLEAIGHRRPKTDRPAKAKGKPKDKPKSKAKGKPKSKAKRAGNVPVERQVCPVEPEEVLRLDGRVRSLERLRLVFAHLGYGYRLNARSWRGEVRDERIHGASTDPFVGWHVLSDELLARIKDDVSRHVVEAVTAKGEEHDRPAIWSTAALHDKLSAWGADAVDPFHVWLLRLPKWDGVHRLDTVLCHVFGASRDDPIVRWAGLAIFLAPVQRTVRLGDDKTTGPGAKLDEMPVLYGAQGIGKSTFVREALPVEAQDDLFTDAYDFQASIKEQVEALKGRVLVENGELAGLDYSSLGRLKAAIPRRTFTGVRAAYARLPAVYARRDFVVGTTDSRECLPNDPEGNRRFGVAELAHGADVSAFMTATREQLWAEALHRFRAGERANLPRELQDVQAAANLDWRRTDQAFEDKVAGLEADPVVVAHVLDGGVFSLRWLSDVTRADGRTVVGDKLEGPVWEARWPASRQAQNRLKSALKVQGWKYDKRRRTVTDPDGAKSNCRPWIAPAGYGDCQP